jgi:hypothetical protein
VDVQVASFLQDTFTTGQALDLVVDQIQDCLLSGCPAGEDLDWSPPDGGLDCSDDMSDDGSSDDSEIESESEESRALVMSLPMPVRWHIIEPLMPALQRLKAEHLETIVQRISCEHILSAPPPLLEAWLCTQHKAGHLDLSKKPLPGGVEGMKALATALQQASQQAAGMGLSFLSLPQWLDAECASHVSCHIAKFTGLRTLSLQNCQIQPVGAIALGQYLPALQALESLRLRMNKLGPDGMQALSQALTQMPQLESLDIGYNYIKDEGARYLSASLAQLPKMRQLLCARNDLGWAAVQQLGETLAKLPRMEKLDLAGNSWDDNVNVALKFLPHMPRLNTLMISHQTLNEPERVLGVGTCLSTLTNLSWLDFTCSCIQTEDLHLLLPFIDKLPMLETLYLSQLEGNVGKHVASLGPSLAAMSSLRALYLAGIRLDTNAAALGQYLAKMPALQLLNMDSAKHWSPILRLYHL